MSSTRSPLLVAEDDLGRLDQGLLALHALFSDYSIRTGKGSIAAVAHSPVATGKAAPPLSVNASFPFTQQSGFTTFVKCPIPWSNWTNPSGNIANAIFQKVLSISLFGLKIRLYRVPSQTPPKTRQREIQPSPNIFLSLCHSPRCSPCHLSCSASHKLISAAGLFQVTRFNLQ